MVRAFWGKGGGGASFQAQVNGNVADMLTGDAALIPGGQFPDDLDTTSLAL